MLDHHRHHHVALSARVFLTFSRHNPLSSIAFSRSSGLSAQSWLYVASSWTSCLCSSMWRGPQEYISSLLLQQCPACLVRLILIVFVMGGKWLYNFCFVGCCLQDLFNIACSILVYLLSSFFSVRLLSVHIVHPYRSINPSAACKKQHLLLSVRSEIVELIN